VWDLAWPRETSRKIGCLDKTPKAIIVAAAAAVIVVEQHSVESEMFALLCVDITLQWLIQHSKTTR